MKRGKVFIKGYYGFGDNIFLYPFIREACKQYKTVYLQTYFPFLYESIPNIKFVKPQRRTTLRTCEQSIANYPESFWSGRPSGIRELTIPYYLTEFRKGNSLIKSFNQGIPIKDKKIDFTLPIQPEWINKAKGVLAQIKTKKKICLIKPPSDRNDWRNSARVPNGKYFQHLINKYKDDYYFITLANRNIETNVYQLQNIDLRFEYGELDLPTIAGLASLSDMIIAYNCFLFPLGVAVKTKTCVINGGYSDPNMYVDYERMDLSKLKIITPTPCCTCLNRSHKCNKHIDISYLESEFENLLYDNQSNQLPEKDKQNMLICRMRATNSSKIAHNYLIKKHFNIFTVDHTSVSNYTTYGNLFKASYRFPSVGDICRPVVDEKKEREIYKFCKEILTKHSINLVLNAQPLHPLNEIMKKACNDLGIKVINSETFFDGKWHFDWKGCQYVSNNEIYDFVDHYTKNTKMPMLLPQTTRQFQPKPITRQEFFNKYKLDPYGKYIVILGQLMWDMSVKQTVNPEIKTYEQYIDLILTSNPDITFIFKPHPLYMRRIYELKFIKKYPNVIFVNESLETLFNIFDYFTSFSSTTVFEGLIKNKRFATIGFHFCNNDQLVFQLRVNHKARNLYDRLKTLRINPHTRERYVRFICNYYAIDLSSPKLYYRLTMPSEEYFQLDL